MRFSFGGVFLNSFETDFSKSILSVRFLTAFGIGILILFTQGYGSDVYRLAHPVVCTFPYACGFLNEYQTGYVKFALPRTSVRAYITGKFFACGIAGGLCEVLPVMTYQMICKPSDAPYHYVLLFGSGMLWAVLALTLATVSENKYIAYGSSFVVCYFLIILKERYFQSLYCLDPFEWYAPKHTWMFDGAGITLLLAGMMIIVFLIFDLVARRKLSYV